MNVSAPLSLREALPDNYCGSDAEELEEYLLKTHLGPTFGGQGKLIDSWERPVVTRRSALKSVYERR